MALRALAALVVGFWLVMSALLLRLQFQPDTSGVLAVPVEHVLRLLFTRGQASELNIMMGDMRYGTMIVRPLSSGTGRELHIAGSTLLRMPLLPHDRLMWEGTLDMESAGAVAGAHGTLALRESGSRVQFSVDKASSRLRYRVGTREIPGEELSVPLTREGAADLLRRAGINPAALQAVDAGTLAMKITAKRGDLNFREEKIESYKISIAQDEVMLAEIYVSQLGQIMTVKTATGLRLVPDNFLQ